VDRASVDRASVDRSSVNGVGQAGCATTVIQRWRANGRALVVVERVLDTQFCLFQLRNRRAVGHGAMGFGFQPGFQIGMTRGQGRFMA
jgi:hypothetical protein